MIFFKLLFLACISNYLLNLCENIFELNTNFRIKSRNFFRENPNLKKKRKCQHVLPNPPAT
jgi:hypothetical protein